MRNTHTCVWGTCVAMEIQREVYSSGGYSLYFSHHSPWGSFRGSELQDITFFIRAPAVLLCKLKAERFQLMMIVRSANIDCCLHYRSGVLVKFLQPSMPGRFWEVPAFSYSCWTANSPISLKLMMIVCPMTAGWLAVLLALWVIFPTMPPSIIS